MEEAFRLYLVKYAILSALAGAGLETPGKKDCLFQAAEAAEAVLNGLGVWH